jgi:hypothetical protein
MKNKGDKGQNKGGKIRKNEKRKGKGLKNEGVRIKKRRGKRSKTKEIENEIEKKVSYEDKNTIDEKNKTKSNTHPF